MSNVAVKIHLRVLAPSLVFPIISNLYRHHEVCFVLLSCFCPIPPLALLAHLLIPTPLISSVPPLAPVPARPSPSGLTTRSLDREAILWKAAVMTSGRSADRLLARGLRTRSTQRKLSRHFPSGKAL